MGWDLWPRARTTSWGTNAYTWRHYVGHALKFSGADMKNFSQYNMGDYVPARVARDWADALENNLADLRVAVFKISPPGPEKTGFIVGKRTTEKRAKAMADRIIGCHGEDVFEFVEFRELSEGDRKFLMQFVRFCRRSKGFWQW